jgi:hypothetical protein
MSALALVNKAEARKRVMSALEKHKVHKGKAAASLGLSYVALRDFVRQLGLEREVERLAARAKREGWFHEDSPMGRPKGSTIENGAAPWGSKRAGRAKA